MAGLGRIQQRFTAALTAVLALVKLSTDTKAGQRARLEAQPLARKFMRTQNYKKATGRDLPPYPGYCSGQRERAKRVGKMIIEATRRAA
jgi:hypothetical protein